MPAGSGFTGGFGFTVSADGGRRLEPGPGWSVAVQVSGRQTGGAFALVEVTLAPGARADEPLVHTKTDVAVRVQEGRVRARLGSEHLVLGAGDVLYASREHPYGLANPFEERAVCTLLLSPSGFETVWAEMAAGGATPKQVARWLDERGARPAPAVVDPWER